MADTLTINISAEDAAKLQRLADEQGESLETLAARILAEAAAAPDAGGQLSEEQLAAARRRSKHPGQFATDEQVERFFARYRAG